MTEEDAGSERQKDRKWETRRQEMRRNLLFSVSIPLKIFHCYNLCFYHCAVFFMTSKLLIIDWLLTGMITCVRCTSRRVSRLCWRWHTCWTGSPWETHTDSWPPGYSLVQKHCGAVRWTHLWKAECGSHAGGPRSKHVPSDPRTDRSFDQSKTWRQHNHYMTEPRKMMVMMNRLSWHVWWNFWFTDH